MTPPSPTFLCPACQNPLPWQSDRVGSSLQCPCGQSPTIPAQPGPGTYDLQSNPAPPATPTPRRPRILSYYTTQPRTRYDFFTGFRLRDLFLPSALMLAGAALYIRLVDQIGASNDGLVCAAIQVAINIAILLLTVLFLRRVADMELGFPIIAASKLLALALFPSAVAAAILETTGCSGLVSAPAFAIGLYALLFHLFFRTGLRETLFCVSITLVLTVISWIFFPAFLVLILFHR